MTLDPHSGAAVIRAGLPLSQARSAVVMAHGRGASAESILALAPDLEGFECAFLAPQATGASWYPNSFLASLESNEPWLSSAHRLLASILDEIAAEGIPAERTILLGFSQGGCLVAEFVARNARRYGGLVVLSGGLIGPPGITRAYGGTLAGTPVFLGCSDSDAHVPEWRVHETDEVLTQMGANVTVRIYPGMGHTVIPDEIDQARAVMRQASGSGRDDAIVSAG